MSSGNPILDKNLESIEKYNPALKDKLLNLPYLTNDIQLIETVLQEPNLSYNNLPLHSQLGAEAEAKEIFDKTIDNTLIVHFVLGIGLGHLFKEFCDRAKGNIVLYESNLEILRVTLELVDFSNEFAQNNVRIASDYKELEQAFAFLYEYKNNVNFAILDSYKTIYGVDAQKILDKIDFINKSLFVDYAYLKGRASEHILSVLDNLTYTLDDIPLSEIKDIYKGKTALIVSAGPSLDLNIKTIKENKDKFVIFCVGTAYKALVKNGIKPDFLVIIELTDCIGQVEGFDLSDINLILQPSTNNSFHVLKTKQKFIYSPNNGPAGKYWGELMDVDVSPYFAGGSVSYVALYSAKILGCEKIILAGSDFAYVNNSCYSKQSAYSDLIFEINPETGKPEYKINNYDSYIKSIVPEGTDITEPWCRDFADDRIKTLNAGLYYIKGISGEMLPTKLTFAGFAEEFSDFASENKNLELINTSMVGAQVDGFENIPLEKVVECLEPVEKLEISTSFKFVKKHILDKLKMEVEMLQEVFSELRIANGYIYRYEMGLKMQEQPTNETDEAFKQLLLIYKKIYQDYYLNNGLYELLSKEENMELEYSIKSTPDKKNWYKALKNYFEKVDEKVLIAMEKFENIINQSLELSTI